MTSAISSGSISVSCPYFVGIGSAFNAIFAEVLMVAVMAVFTLPGATALMRTPLAAHEEDVLLTQRARAYLVDT